MSRYQAGAARAGDPGRAEIARAVPGGSRRVRGKRIERVYLTALGAFGPLLRLRADARDNTIQVAKQLARHASYQTGTTRPTRARICRLAGICESAWKAARRRLEAWGFLATVVQGTTPEFLPVHMALAAGKDAPNTAAVYVLCVPRVLAAPQVTHETRPPTPSSLLEGSRAPRAGARQNPGNPKGPASGRTRPEAAALAAAGPLAGVVRKAAGQGITDGWSAWLARPFAAAGWTARDLLWAVDHEPAGPQHRLSARVRHPVGWIRWRLGLWLDSNGAALPSLSQIRAASRDAIRETRLRLRALTGDRPARLAQVLEERAREIAAARAAEPSERAAELAERLAGRARTEPPKLPSG